MAVTVDLSGKTAIVTGGGRGIGRETALLLAKAGACIAIADIDEASAASVVPRLPNLARKISPTLMPRSSRPRGARSPVG